MSHPVPRGSTGYKAERELEPPPHLGTAQTCSAHPDTLMGGLTDDSDAVSISGGEGIPEE
jgi:hypothetical protein